MILCKLNRALYVVSIVGCGSLAILFSIFLVMIIAGKNTTMDMVDAFCFLIALCVCLYAIFVTPYKVCIYDKYMESVAFLKKKKICYCDVKSLILSTKKSCVVESTTTKIEITKDMSNSSNALLFLYKELNNQHNTKIIGEPEIIKDFEHRAFMNDNFE